MLERKGELTPIVARSFTSVGKHHACQATVPRDRGKRPRCDRRSPDEGVRAPQPSVLDAWSAPGGRPIAAARRAALRLSEGKRRPAGRLPAVDLLDQDDRRAG